MKKKSTCVEKIIKIDIQETNNKEVKYEIIKKFKYIYREKKIFDHISLFSNKKEVKNL